MSMNKSTKSISQEEGNKCIEDFLKRNGNKPVRRGILMAELREKLQANDNQATGLIQRAYSPSTRSGEKTLIKDGKNYSLRVSGKTESIIDDVKNQIANFYQDLSKNISVDKVSSPEEFKQIKELLEHLNLLTD